MLKSTKPVISVCAVRTGVGKSPVTRFIARVLREQGMRVAAVRHPMPYGDLARQAMQRYACLEDLDLNDCTIEEREEYEPHIVAGDLIFAGVDYERILRVAEAEADVILWDGGNNDLPFYKPDLEIVLADPHRPGHERSYYPGEANILRADVVVLTKTDTADRSAIDKVRASVAELNPRATIIETAMPPTVEDPAAIRGKRVLVVEDGPTATHGGMGYGAGYMAAKAYGAAEIVDPRPFAVGSLRSVFEDFPHLHDVLPAMGYGDEQVADLGETIEAADCDVVMIASPVDLRKLLHLKKPAVRVRYEMQELGPPHLGTMVRDFAHRLAHV
jgi:predicted GTPase